jgi:hypothetical protein
MNSMMNDQVLQCQGHHHVDLLIVIPIPSRIIICLLDMNMIFYILAPSAHQTFSSTKKTDSRNITEILLKVALNTITLTPVSNSPFIHTQISMLLIEKSPNPHSPSAHQTLNLEFTRGGECHEWRDYEFYWLRNSIINLWYISYWCQTSVCLMILLNEYKLVLVHEIDLVHYNYAMLPYTVSNS